MLYQIIRSLIKVCLHFYIKRMGWAGLENIPKDKPVLFCSTHSNSFLDALPIASYLGRPVYELARGDAFRKPFFSNMLYGFKMLPIFRQQDGEPNSMRKNEKTFEDCQELFRKKQFIMIYPEGICKHQKEVLPLKKGAVVMAQRAWREGLPLQVIPVGVYYDSFSKWGKKCDITFGKAIQITDFQDIEQKDFAKEFNEKVGGEMKKLFPSPYNFQNNPTHWGIFGKLLYYMGWLINAPLYLVAWLLGKKFAGKGVFFDSATLGFIVILLPFYYLMLLGLYFVFV
jgi:1-acyl-sn-glycerol-3-phosphate acyltransferase